jgi:hypothetical protein
MQSVPEDEQCEHFKLDGVPSPAEYQEEMRQSREVGTHTSNWIGIALQSSREGK